MNGLDQFSEENPLNPTYSSIVRGSKDILDTSLGYISKTYVTSAEVFQEVYAQSDDYINLGYVTTGNYGTWVDVGKDGDTSNDVWYDISWFGDGEFGAPRRYLGLGKDETIDPTPTNTGPVGGPIPDDNRPDHSRPDPTDDTAAVVVAPVEPTIEDVAGGNTNPVGTGFTYDTGGVTYTGDITGANIPVILDLDGDGVEVAFGEDIYFDLDDDGFLVIDRNADGSRGAGDGVIDQSNELVLSSLGLEGDTDLQALARYDDNGDGKLDASDAIWNELKVWQDLNQDGKTEGDGTELKTLAAWGISSINIAYDDGTDFTDESNDVEVFGNILNGLAVAA